MNLNNLHRRIDKLLATVEQLQPEVPELADVFTWDLLTVQEQDLFRAFVDQVQPKIKRSRTGGLDLNELTVEEKDALESWIVLHQSLESGDTAQAERCRRYLLLTPEDKEQIYSAFMAIDERCLPDVTYCSEAPTIQWDGTTHHIYQGGYRWQREHMKQHKEHTGYLRRWEIDSMWLWLEQSAQLGSRGLLV